MTSEGLDFINILNMIIQKHCFKVGGKNRNEEWNGGGNRKKIYQPGKT